MTEKPKEAWDLTDTTHPLYDPMKDPGHPFYEADQKEKPASRSSAYKVGPGFPPNEHKWKKGCRSPYPKGRPRKVPSMKPDLRKALEGALNEKVVITKDNKEVVLTKASLGIQQLVNQFAKGDRYARRDLFEYAALLGVDLQAKELIVEALGINEQAIVDAFVRRQGQQTPAPAEPETRVKAPPDLMDDDVTPPKSDQPDKPAAVAPNREPLPPKPKPELDERGRPKPRDREFMERERQWNMAREKRNQEES